MRMLPKPIAKSFERLSTKLLAVGIGLFLLSFLVSYAMLGEDRYNLALKSIKYQQFHSGSSQLFYSHLATLDCDETSTCYKQLFNLGFLGEAPIGQDTLDLSPHLSEDDKSSDNVWVLLRFNLSVPEGSIDTSDPLVLSFPEFYYRRAGLFWNGHFQKNAFDDEPLTLSFDKDALSDNQGLTVDLVLNLRTTNTQHVTYWEQPFFVASHSDYQRYLDHVYLTKLGQGEQVGMIARIVLAIMVLVFYVTIDSSPSALGLSLAMGFEAAGMSLGNVGLEHQWITPAPYWHAIALGLYSVADFMNLFFLLQLAGRQKPRFRTLLASGCIFGAVYGIYLVYFRDLAIPSSYFWFPRIVGTSGIGLAFCMVAFVTSIGKKDVWRSLALAMAILGAGIELFDAFSSMSDFFDSLPGFTAFMTLGKALKAYLYTLSALVAVASMRKELRALAVVKENSRKMEHELHLGREMQQTLLHVPKLPDGIQVYVSHEAAAYVSGDTYFFDWNPEINVLTVLLNDVPGHGLQAALKAFACNVIAKSVWNHAEAARDRRRYRSKFPIYDRQVGELLSHQADEAPFNAFVGAEYFLDRGTAAVYRSNYNYPIVVRYLPESGQWEASSIAIHNRKVLEIALTPGTYLILASDGLISTSKDQTRLLRHLSETLPTQASELSAATLATLIGGGLASTPVIDDRSLIIVRWNRKLLDVPATPESNSAA